MVMGSSFGQELDLFKSKRGLEHVSFDDHETTKDELSKNLDSSTSGNDKMVQGCTEILPRILEAVEPSVGMEFKSKDDAREFYVLYGRHIGFTVRIHSNRRSRTNNEVISQDFVCSKEGFRAKKYIYRKDKVITRAPITREGCRAMIRVALKGGEKWVISKFVKDHSHKLLSPSKVPSQRSDKILVSEDEKDKKIRELSAELDSERRKCKRLCAVYQKQLQMILKDVEQHTEHLSRKVQDIVKSIREIEDQNPEDSQP